MRYLGTRLEQLTAETSFKEGTEVRTVIFAASSSLDAAAEGVVALEARVFAHISIQNFPSKTVLSTATVMNDSQDIHTKKK